MKKIKSVFNKYPKSISYLFTLIWYFFSISHLGFYENALCNIFLVTIQFFGIAMLPLWLGLKLSIKKKHYINGVILFGLLSIFMVLFVIYDCSVK